jgi:hypothetical protein
LFYESLCAGYSVSELNVALPQLLLKIVVLFLVPLEVFLGLYSDFR